MRRFNNDNMKRKGDGEYPSHVLIAGDFGLVYSTNPADRLEHELIDWLDLKPWETIALLGNHENYERAYALPLMEHLGALMYRVSEKVWLMQHGNVYTIEGKTFFAFGGATSIDKASRQDRLSWWEEEIPTRADFDRGVRSLEAVGGKVDYVITHTAPREAIDTVIGKPTILGAADREQEEARFDDPTVAFSWNSENISTSERSRSGFSGTSTRKPYSAETCRGSCITGSTWISPASGSRPLLTSAS